MIVISFKFYLNFRTKVISCDTFLRLSLLQSAIRIINQRHITAAGRVLCKIQIDEDWLRMCKFSTKPEKVALWVAKRMYADHELYLVPKQIQSLVQHWWKVCTVKCKWFSCKCFWEMIKRICSNLFKSVQYCSTRFYWIVFNVIVKQ